VRQGNQVIAIMPQIGPAPAPSMPFSSPASGTSQGTAQPFSAALEQANSSGGDSMSSQAGSTQGASGTHDMASGPAKRDVKPSAGKSADSKTTDAQGIENSQAQIPLPSAPSQLPPSPLLPWNLGLKAIGPTEPVTGSSPKSKGTLQQPSGEDFLSKPEAVARPTLAPLSRVADSQSPTKPVDSGNPANANGNNSFATDSLLAAMSDKGSSASKTLPANGATPAHSAAPSAAGTPDAAEKAKVAIKTQIEDVLGKLLADREYMAAIAKAANLFVPGSAHDQLWRHM